MSAGDDRQRPEQPDRACARAAVRRRRPVSCVSSCVSTFSPSRRGLARPARGARRRARVRREAEAGATRRRRRSRCRGARSSHGRRGAEQARPAARRTRQTRANVAAAYRSTSCEPVADGAPAEREQHGEHGEDRQRVGVEPRREQRPAALGDAARRRSGSGTRATVAPNDASQSRGVSTRPEPRRAGSRRWPSARRSASPAVAVACARTSRQATAASASAASEPDAGEQERVVRRHRCAGLTRASDRPQRDAAAGELTDQGEQGEPRYLGRPPTCPSHDAIILPAPCGRTPQPTRAT